MGGGLITWVEGPNGEWLDRGTAGAGNGAGGAIEMAGAEVEMCAVTGDHNEKRRLLAIAIQIYAAELAALETALPVLPVRKDNPHSQKGGRVKRVTWADDDEEDEDSSEDDADPEYFRKHARPSNFDA